MIIFDNIWIFYMLSFLTIFFGCRTILSKDPISSVVNLVGTFVSCAGIWISLEIYLLGLIYIIVYVGAIAILFIFVIMMMDLRQTYHHKTIKLTTVKTTITPFKKIGSSGIFSGSTEGESRWPYGHPLIFVLLLLFFIGMLWLGFTSYKGINPGWDHQLNFFNISKNIFYQDYFSIWEIAQRNIWDSLLISLDLIHSIGYILYTDLLSLLLVVSLILLMIMIGVIVITTEKSVTLKG